MADTGRGREALVLVEGFVPPRPGLTRAGARERDHAQHLGMVGQTPIDPGFLGDRQLEHDLLAFGQRDEAFLDRFVPRHMQQVLTQNGMKLSENWSQMKQDRALRIVRSSEGSALTAGGGVAKGYVMTVDNLCKMLCVQMRLK